MDEILGPETVRNSENRAFRVAVHDDLAAVRQREFRAVVRDVFAAGRREASPPDEPHRRPLRTRGDEKSPGVGDAAKAQTVRADQFCVRSRRRTGDRALARSLVAEPSVGARSRDVHSSAKRSKPDPAGSNAIPSSSTHA